MPTDLRGWHRGELAIQKKLNFDGVMSTAYTWIESGMPWEHREFHSTRLHFVPVTTLDQSGRPWASLLAGKDGQPGFIAGPSETILDLKLRIWEGDPFAENIKLFTEHNNLLVAGLGIEFPTRRRNKFAGVISKVDTQENDVQLQFTVNQAIGNCPKYINIRDLVPHPSTKPIIVYKKLQLTATDRLPDDIISFIIASDTVFLGTTYVAGSEETEKNFPSHVGMNQRGGRPGFIRVKPSDGRTVVLPDYSGNRLMTSLGNIEATPLAALTFLSFSTGSIIYLTGNAENIVGPSAQKIMPLHDAITTVYATGCILIDDALPVRQRQGTSVGRSPYSPPARPLAEESIQASATYFNDADAVSATLAAIEIHNSSLATFTWETPKEVEIKPGQTAIMNFSSLLGQKQYQHMDPGRPTAVNDDRIRTWTVSRSGAWSYDLNKHGTNTFALTMREKPGGMVTGALFTIARKLAEHKPELLRDARALGLQVVLTGISGDFTLPESHPPPESENVNQFLWIAGGIGLTPFLGMLSALRSVRTQDPDDLIDVILAVSTREPGITLSLISQSLQSALKASERRCIKLTIVIFSNHPVPESTPVSDQTMELSVRFHNGRISSMFFSSVSSLRSRAKYMCGPEEFEKSVESALATAGVQGDTIKREGFGY